MKFVFIAAVLLAINIAFATQTLSKGQFLYDNLSVAQGEIIAVGVNTTSGTGLLVIPSSEYSSFLYSKKIFPLYNHTVNTGIYYITVPAGNYTVIAKALRSTDMDIGTLVIPLGSNKTITVNGQYLYNFSLSNYSNVRLSILSAEDFSKVPFVVNFSNTPTVVSLPTNLDYIDSSFNRGKHVIAINTSSRMSFLLILNATPLLVNPLIATFPGKNYSVGVAGYGLFNISGDLHPYQVKTPEVLGLANISLLSATTPNPPSNGSGSGASLQLNAALNTYINNTLRVYWLQDVVDFNTSSGRYYLVDNIWNNTTPFASVSNSSLVGQGGFSICQSCDGQEIYFDAYPDQYLNYSLPLSLKIVIKENQTSNGTVVRFGYQVLRNGTSAQASPLIFFDHVLIPRSNNSTFITTPYYYTPAGKGLFGNYYDTELVFAGESGGANTKFTSLGSSLWIYYLANGTIKPFPSVYTFGLSTAETASNARTQPGPLGAVVILGKPDLSKDIFAPNALIAFTQYIANTSKNTQNATTTVKKSGSGGNIQIVINPANSQKSIEVVAIAVILIIIILILEMRRRNRKRLEAMGYTPL